MDIKQYTAVLHLATGATNKEAAHAVGVSLSALEKWKQRREFQQLLKEAIEQVYSASIAELAKGALESAAELRRIAIDPDTSDRVKVSAISTIFSQLDKFKSWDLEQRLERVEKLLDGTDTSKAATD